MPARAIRCGAQPAMSRPFHSTRPLVGGVSPITERIVVVLPTPLRPSRHDALAGRDLERDAEQHPAQAIGGVDVLDGEQRGHQSCSPR